MSDGEEIDLLRGAGIFKTTQVEARNGGVNGPAYRHLGQAVIIASDRRQLRQAAGIARHAIAMT